MMVKTAQCVLDDSCINLQLYIKTHNCGWDCETKTGCNWGSPFYQGLHIRFCFIHKRTSIDNALLKNNKKPKL